MEIVLYIVIGAVVGALVAWLIASSKLATARQQTAVPS